MFVCYVFYSASWCGVRQFVPWFQCVTKRIEMNKQQQQRRRRRRRRQKLRGLQTNIPTKKKHMKTWHTSIWEWIIRFSYLLRIYLNEVCFSYPMLCSHLTNCLAQRTQHSRWYYLSITKFNVRCFIISFRFVCLLVNGFCLRSISRGSEWLFILLYCMGVLSDASFMSFSISFCCCSFYLFSIFIHLAVKGRCSVFTTMDIITFV